MLESTKVIEFENNVMGKHLGVICSNSQGDKLEVIFSDSIVIKYNLKAGDILTYRYERDLLVVEMSKKK